MSSAVASSKMRRNVVQDLQRNASKARKARLSQEGWCHAAAVATAAAAESRTMCAHAQASPDVP